MDFVPVLCAIISAVSAYVVARAGTKVQKEKKKEEETAARREKESRLSMEMIFSTLELSYVTSLAVTGGHINGNVEAAQQKADKAREAYEAFLRDEAARAVATI